MHLDYRYRATVASVYDGGTFQADVDFGSSVGPKNVSARRVGTDTRSRAGRRPRRRRGSRPTFSCVRLVPVGAPVLIEPAETGAYGRYSADVLFGTGAGTVHVSRVPLLSGHAVTDPAC